MATPITSIQKQQVSENEIKQQKLDELTELVTKNDEALSKILSIVGELNEAGILEATDALLQAKEKVANIAIQQVAREPVTNLINVVMSLASTMSTMSPDSTRKLLQSLESGMNEANKEITNEAKLSMFDLLKALKDPDINRAIQFGLYFLKGVGKELKE